MIVRYDVAIVLPDQEDELLALEEADTVMRERNGYDEDYGFDYEIQFSRKEPQ